MEGKKFTTGDKNSPRQAHCVGLRAGATQHAHTRLEGAPPKKIPAPSLSAIFCVEYGHSPPACLQKFLSLPSSPSRVPRPFFLFFFPFPPFTTSSESITFLFSPPLREETLSQKAALLRICDTFFHYPPYLPFFCAFLVRPRFDGGIREILQKKYNKTKQKNNNNKKTPIWDLLVCVEAHRFRFFLFFLPSATTVRPSR